MKIIISESTHSNRKGGFSSPNFPYDRMKEMQRLGGKRGHLKGFACLTPEERKNIARMGRKAKNISKKLNNSFDVI